MRRRCFWFSVQPVAVMLAALPAWAEPTLPASPHPDLLRTYYDYGVAEYCGLVDAPVHNGFALLRLDQLARGHVGPTDEKAVRIMALRAVDDEYQDRGLSGQKTWCRTEGGDAVRRFTAYFRNRQLPPPSP
ncbi:hypothetical protein [Dongia sp.]|uniref:hypothetical protein n=1 Tax=Dongia sp. TaxID=1977262 RepID=UPI0035B4243D